MGGENGGSCVEGMWSEGDGGSSGPGGEDPSGVNERVVRSTPCICVGSVLLVDGGLVGRDRLCCDCGKEGPVEGHRSRVEVEGGGCCCCKNVSCEYEEVESSDETSPFCEKGGPATW